MKKLVHFIAFVLFAIVCYGQNEKSTQTEFTEMYLPVWQTATAHCLEVATTMPEALYSYKPTDVSKTFAEQMVHIGYTVELLTKRYVQGMEVKADAPDASKMTKAEIIELMEKGFAYVTQVIHELKQEQLEEKCVMYHSGNTVSRAFALFYVQDHMNNHRAKANLYIRMNNIQPPAYTW